MLSFNLAPPVPFMTYEEYSRFSGIPFNTVKDHAGKGIIIIKKKEKPGDKPLVNVIAMFEMAARQTIEKLG